MTRLFERRKFLQIVLESGKERSDCQGFGMNLAIFRLSSLLEDFEFKSKGRVNLSPDLKLITEHWVSSSHKIFRFSARNKADEATLAAGLFNP